MSEKAPRLVSAHLYHYVTFLLVVPEISFGAMKQTEQVSSRDPHQLGKLPEYCYAFFYFDRLSATVQWEGEVHELGKELKHSGRYYVAGKIHTLADVERLTAKGELERDYPLKHMQKKALERMILVAPNNWQPFTKHDVLLEPRAG